MCIIIDTNALSAVFNSKSIDHEEFRPVKNWLKTNGTSLVYGGTKYLKEIKEMTEILKMISEYRKIGKASHINDELVDDEQSRIEALCTDHDFDDPHIIALVVASKCRLVCSKDRRSYRYLRDKRFYPSSCQKPSIYSGFRNHKLLNSGNIVKLCNCM